MKKIIKVIFIISLFLLLTNCYLKKGESPFIFQIQSGSMMPEINVNEIVILWKCKEYKEKDIITYKVDNSYFVTHRIVKKIQEGYITKGDSNNTEDEQVVTKEQIQGKVIFHSNILGKIYKFRYYLIAILILLLLI